MDDVEGDALVGAAPPSLSEERYPAHSKESSLMSRAQSRKLVSNADKELEIRVKAVDENARKRHANIMAQFTATMAQFETRHLELEESVRQLATVMHAFVAEYNSRSVAGRMHRFRVWLARVRGLTPVLPRRVPLPQPDVVGELMADPMQAELPLERGGQS